MTKCTIPNCSKNAIAKGLCNGHYIRQKRGKSMDKPLQVFNPTKTCIDCGEKTNGKGGYLRCSKHYKIYKRKTIKEKLIEKLGGKCVDCGGVFHYAAFDFHHLSDKIDDISSMMDKKSEEEIFKEAEKCVLLCANCHRIRHVE